MPCSPILDLLNLDVQLLELLVVGLPGREVLHSRREEIAAIEFNKDRLLPLELAQADLLPRRAGERKVRRLLSDLHCYGHASQTQHAGQQHPQQKQPFRAFCQHNASSFFAKVSTYTTNTDPPLFRLPT